MDRLSAARQQELDRLDRLMETVDDVDLTAEENVVMRWLAGWDDRTVDPIITIIRKVRDRPAPETSSRASQTTTPADDRPRHGDPLGPASPSP